MVDPVLNVVKKLNRSTDTTGEIKSLINEVKFLLEDNTCYAADFNSCDSKYNIIEMMPFNPQLRDPYDGGHRWLAQLQQNLNEKDSCQWIPECTQPLFGIDLTGIWAPSLNPLDQCYIRQYGPYLNYLAGTAGIPSIFAEGLLNPITGRLILIGKDIFKNPFFANLHLCSEWSLNGLMSMVDVYGEAIEAFTEIYRMA